MHSFVYIRFSSACAHQHSFNPRAKQVAHHVLWVQLVLRGRQQCPTRAAAVWSAAAAAATAAAAIPATWRLPGRIDASAYGLRGWTNATSVYRFPGPAAGLRTAAAITATVYRFPWPASPAIPTATGPSTSALSDWRASPATAAASCSTAETSAYGHDVGADG